MMNISSQNQTNMMKRVAKWQKLKIIHFVKNSPIFDKELGKTYTKEQKYALWVELTEQLNIGSNDPKASVKTVDQWKKCWRDYKSDLKRKYKAHLKDPENRHISSVDREAISVLGIQNLLEDTQQSSIAIASTEDTLHHTIPIPDDNVEDSNIKISSYSSYKSDESDSSDLLETKIFYELPEAIAHLTNLDRKNAERIHIKPVSIPNVAKCPENKRDSTIPDRDTNMTRNLITAQKSTAEALMAIAKEMSVKNEIAKRKLELKERQVLAFELMAKSMSKN